MAFFLDSTQAAEWTLTTNEVSSRRNSAREAVIKRCQHIATPVKPLSHQEESIIRFYHERRILHFVRQVRFHNNVGATAVTYFKRFFVDRSVCDYNPSVIALSALYAAFKVEEKIMTVDDLVAQFDSILNGVRHNTSRDVQPDSADGCSSRVSVDALLQTELSFLQMLRFHLICYHPFKSLRVIEERLQSSQVLRRACDDDDDRVKQLLRRLSERARVVVRKRALVCDVMLTYTPGVVALGVAVMAARDEGVLDDGWGVLTAAGIEENGGQMKAVRSRVEKVIAEMDAVGKISDDVKVVKEIEKRRRAAQKNENDPMSEEYAEVEELREAEEDERQIARGVEDRERRAKRDRKVMGWDVSDDELEREIDEGRKRRRLSTDIQ